VKLAVLLVAVGAGALVLVGPGGASADPFRELGLIRPGKTTAAPGFDVPALGGARLRLADLRRKVVFLNFWATWCPPCREEMPSMERAHHRHRDRGLTIVALALDCEPDPVVAFVQSLGLTFPIGLDPGFEVANRYAVRAPPSSFLIDRQGAVVAVALGPRDWDGNAARAVFESMLR